MVDSVRLLHVDDEPDYAEMTAEFLEREDDRITVETATGVDEARNRLDDRQYDCIVSDYDMPGQNGIEFLETIRETYPDVPFILFTGKGSEDVAGDAFTAGATDYLQKQSGSDQYSLLAKRITNAVEQYRATRRAASLERTRRVVRDVNQALVRAETREEIERRTCEIISNADPYRFAWIGEHDPESRIVEPRTAAGVGDNYLGSIRVTTDEQPTSRGPTGMAVRNRELTVVQNIREDDGYEPWREEALERGYRSSAAIPLVQDDTLYGVLNVYAERADAFDDRERELLTELGDDIAHALSAQRTSADLRRAKERFQALFENAPVPVVAGDVRDGGDAHLIRDVNDAFEDVFDFDAEDVVSRDIAEVVVPDDGIERHDEHRERAAAGKASVAEVERVTAAGSRLFLLHVIPYGTDGTHADGWFAWYSDITDHRERQRELKRYERIIREMNDGVVFVEDRHITYTNPQVSKLTGYDAEEIHGQPMRRFIAPGDRDTVEQRFRERIAGKDPPSIYEISVVSKEGEQIPVEITAGRVEYDGQPATVSIVRDITERKQHERELERRNERLDEFASIVSHDLRNPLNVASGRLELVRTELESEHLEHVAHALDRMDSLIDDLLTIARHGKPAENADTIDLAVIMETCWRNVDTADASLVTETDRSIRADPSRLQQLLENLLRNAIEHGGGDVTITIGDIDDDGFYVEDDGPGVSGAEREKVFERGYSTLEDGTGFGLAIVEQVAEACDWEVRLTDGTAGGARFEIGGVEFVS